MTAPPPLPAAPSPGEVLAGAVTGSLTGTAAVIMCMPCERSGGYFVPTAELVLADLTGRRDPHPVLALARRLAIMPPETPGPRVLVLFDDLDVGRNWILPPDPPATERLWPAVRAAALRALDTGPGGPRADVELLSDWLDRHRARAVYEQAVRRDTARFLASLTRTDTAGPGAGELAAARRLMTAQPARRRRHPPPRGHAGRHGLRLRAARHLANYAVQGRMMAAASPAAYLTGGTEETEKMAVFCPAFTRLTTIAPPHAPAPGSAAAPGERDGRELVAAAIPERFADLRGCLPLYLEDLPGTPGAVVPGLAADIVSAIGKVLTPGTARTGAAEVAALNRILPGGAANRERAAGLLDLLLSVVGAPPDPARPGADPAGEAARKLFGHLASRWQDDALATEHRRHLRTLAHLSRAVGDGDGDEAEQVALALTGSLATAPGGWWHPYLSDIDVMPLRTRQPTADQVARLHQIYQDTPRPAWVYLNTGACPGVAGTVTDPRMRLFVAEHLPDLTPPERRLLGDLVGASRLLAGDAGVYERFRAALTSPAVTGPAAGTAAAATAGRRR